jgi:drug/metabolite transporter (DMT)-like permease
MFDDSQDDPMVAHLIHPDPPSKGEMPPIKKLFWAGIMLTSGTCTTLFANTMFMQKAEGSAACTLEDDDTTCKFNKPWFSVLLMKLAMAMCLPLYYGVGWGKEDPSAPNPSWKTIKGVWLPSVLDLLNTILGNVGLLWVSPSIYQMTRGSVVIFSALLSVKWLGRTLRSFHYWAILMVIVAVVLVGLAGIEATKDGDDDGSCGDDDDGGGGGGDDDDSGGAGNVIMGLLFIVAAQAVTAVQFITEEEFMNEFKATKLDPVALVGFEGLWGLVYFAVIAPIMTYTPPSDEAISIVWHEDFNDTFVQLSNSPTIVWLCVGYFVTILMYNVSANVVTKVLSAVVRSILEACRTLGVWMVSLIFFYVGQKCIGEEWTNWSLLELFGFVVLIAGTFSYKALIKLPCVSEAVYEQARDDDAQFADEQQRRAQEAESGRQRSTDKYRFLPESV